MTIDEAITYCREKEVNEKSKGNLSCSQEYHQLAEWLTELKNRRAAEILIVAELSNLKAEFVNFTSQIRFRENSK